jgi:octaprenyl-diphosphate synthase
MHLLLAVRFGRPSEAPEGPGVPGHRGDGELPTPSIFGTVAALAHRDRYMQTTLTQPLGGPSRLTASEVFSLVRDDLALVESDLASLLGSEVSQIDEMGRYLREGGGKRIRPALLLVAARACAGRKDLPAAIRMAAVMEMLHTATLVHDDIIDAAETRRGRPSVNTQWGNERAVLMGDWLYMKAFDVTLAGRNFDILDLLTSMTRRMTEGELIQLGLLGRIDISVDDHLEIVRRKTAFMFSSCAEIGAIVADASSSQRAALSAYGLNAGIAFQLIDDVLDFVSTEDKLGKPVANDLREGKLTLPLIYLLELGDPEHRRAVETVVLEGGFESVSRDRILGLVRDSGTLDRARAEARRYAARAAGALDDVPDSEFRRALLSIPNFIVEREM